MSLVQAYHNVDLCLLAVQMTNTMCVVCYLNVLECEMVY